MVYFEICLSYGLQSVTAGHLKLKLDVETDCIQNWSHRIVSQIEFATFVYCYLAKKLLSVNAESSGCAYENNHHRSRSSVFLCREIIIITWNITIDFFCQKGLKACICDIYIVIERLRQPTIITNANKIPCTFCVFFHSYSMILRNKFLRIQIQSFVAWHGKW